MEFSVDLDDRLRAAASGQRPDRGGDQAPTGQWETQMESSLRPRDIQARIRAGETAESVALVAGTSVDKVMPYAAPVLAERAHVAQRAQRASIRRRPVEAGPTSTARTLGDAVGTHLRAQNVDPDTVSWDAWRREDGRWTLTASYTTTGRVGAAHFSFDAPGNYVVADDDDAHWLLGEIPDEPEPAAAVDRDDLSDARRRHLSAVPPDELPLGEDALELVSESPEPVPRRSPRRWPTTGPRRPRPWAPRPRSRPTSTTRYRRGRGRGRDGRRDRRRGPGRPRRCRRRSTSLAGTSRRRASRSRRPAVGRRSRAGTRSCSVDPTTAAPDATLARIVRLSSACSGCSGGRPRGWWCDQCSITRDQLNGPKLVAVVAACPPA